MAQDNKISFLYSVSSLEYSVLVVLEFIVLVDLANKNGIISNLKDRVDAIQGHIAMGGQGLQTILMGTGIEDGGSVTANSNQLRSDNQEVQKLVADEGWKAKVQSLEMGLFDIMVLMAELISMGCILA